MRANATRAARALVSGLALALAACGSQSERTLRVVTVGDSAALFAAEIAAADSPARMLRSATTEGLVGFDEEGRVIPALADRWIVLDDGQSYIFRLREGTWADGRLLTAQSAQVALREAIAGLKGRSLAIDLATIEDIRVMAPRVVEIRLRQPMPDLLQLLAQPELGLVYHGTSAGPMALERIGDSALLTPIRPEKLGLSATGDWGGRIRTIELSAQTGQRAVEQFRRGDADLMLGGTAIQFPLTGSLGIGRGAIKMDAVPGLFGLAVMNESGVLADAATREAVSMAIDRDALVGAFGVAGWSATARVVPEDAPEGLGASGERWPGMSLDDRRNKARAAIERWRIQKGGNNAPALRIALPEGPGAAIIFNRLAADFGSIGISLERAVRRQDADLQLVDTVARYTASSWYLNQFNCGLNRGACDLGTDALMVQVRLTGDADTRSRLLGEAEASLTHANVFLPLAQPMRWSLARGDATGFSINRLGFHPLMPLAIKPK
jgi:peptide/nickel transport system substrate-binding protein/oligopeptide transport system substrate-binding protein